jgi:predicted esterase
MKTQTNILFLILFILHNLLISNSLFGIEKEKTSVMVKSDDVSTFKSLLKSLSENADNELFSLHFQSMLDVIEAKGTLTHSDTILLQATLPVFSNSSVSGNASLSSSYLDRGRQLTISWVSPADGKVSFFRLRLPKNWDPNKSYPLYIELHGLWDVANNQIEFMTYAYRNNPSTSFQFEDGYQILPWGRGNLWYLGISETDIWEGIEKIESLVKIDQSRKYLTGHSMGGFGAWSIAAKSADVWAAIGIHAGALWYGNDNMLSSDKIENLSETPTYFVVGNSDGLYNINLQASNLLKSAGNQDVEFVSFTGGHDYLTVNVENMYVWLREFENENYTGFLESKERGENSVLICPNPVRSETSIHLNLEKSGHVRLNLYNSEGMKVAAILNKKLMSGETIIEWNRGKLQPGIYTYSFVFGQTKNNGKLVLY